MTDHLHLRQDADGTAFIQYHDPEQVLTFSWSGDYAQPVEVTREAGEPIIATFRITDDDMTWAMRRTEAFNTEPGYFTHLLRAFRHICRGREIL